MGCVQTAGDASQTIPSSPEPFNSRTSQMKNFNLESETKLSRLIITVELIFNRK